MATKQEILNNIKIIVKEVVPDAKIFLFGSRLINKETEESDWDILILTDTKYDKAMRWKIQDALFPLSVRLYAFIDVTMVQENEWNTKPEYYSLRKNLLAQPLMAL